MRKVLLATAAAVGLTVVAVGAASAADLPPPVYVEVPHVVTPPPQVVTPPPVQAAGGWYLRGDIGYKLYSDPDASFNGDDFINEDLDDTWMFGVGIGYDTGTGLRGDVTFDYETQADFEGNLECIDVGCSTGATEYSTERADIEAYTALVNVYYDLPEVLGFTPYVGAGIGASYLRTTDVTSVNPASINPTGVVDTHDGDGNWNFAWALMAGASYDVTDHIALDFGYRYLNLGDAVSGPITAQGVTEPIRYDDIDAHEFRAGVRYTF